MNSMPPTPISPIRSENDVSLIEFVNAVLRNWRTVVALPLLLAALAVAWSLTRDQMYIVGASFMPLSTESRGVAGAAAIAQQLGVNLGGERPGQSPQFYVDLLNSWTLLRKAVESQYRIDEASGAGRPFTLIEHWNLEGDGGVAAWRRAAQRLRERISTSVNAETGVVGLRLESTHPALGEQVVERILQLLNEFNLEIQRQRAQDESRFVGERVAEAHQELVNAESALQRFLRSNRGFGNSPDLTFEHERLQRSVGIRQEVYTSLLRAQEQAQIDAMRDTPQFTVIDRPEGSAEPRGRGTVMKALLALMLGLMLALAAAFVAEFKRRSQDSQDPHYMQFQKLASETWSELRRPDRWIRRGSQPR